MLVSIPPEQIRESWELIRPMIVQTLSPTLRVSADAMGNILRSLLAEEAHLWAYYRNEGDGKPLALTITTVVTDNVVGARYLLIYSMYAMAKLDRADYLNGMVTLRNYAESQECKDVIAYVENDNFVGVLGQVGGVKITNLVRL